MFAGDLVFLVLMSLGFVSFVLNGSDSPWSLTKLSLARGSTSWKIAFWGVHFHALLMWGLFVLLLRNDPLATIACSKPLCSTSHYGTAQAAFLVWAGFSVLFVLKAHELNRAPKKALQVLPKARVYEFSRQVSRPFTR